MATREGGVGVLSVLDGCIESAKAIVKDCNGDPRAELYLMHVKQSRAKVVELINAADALLSYRHGTYPVEGYLRDNDASRAQLDAVATALLAARGNA